MREHIDKWVRDVVLEALEDTICISKDSIAMQHDILRDLKMNSDDASFEFIPSIERRLDIDIPESEWLKATTVGEVIELVKKYKMT